MAGSSFLPQRGYPCCNLAKLTFSGVGRRTEVTTLVGCCFDRTTMPGYPTSAYIIPPAGCCPALHQRALSAIGRYIQGRSLCHVCIEWHGRWRATFHASPGPWHARCARQCSVILNGPPPIQRDSAGFMLVQQFMCASGPWWLWLQFVTGNACQRVIEARSLHSYMI